MSNNYWYLDIISDQFCPNRLYPSMFLSTTIVSIGILSIILILTFGIKSILNKSRDIHLFFRSTFWISLFCILLWLLLWPIAIYLCEISKNHYNLIKIKFAFMLQISGIFFAIVIRACYIGTWYKRLTIVFKDSIFDVAGRTKLGLCIFGLFIIIVKITSFILFIISYINEHVQIKHHYNQFGRGFAIFGEIIYCLFIIFIVSLFLNKLTRLIFNAANRIHKSRDIDNIRLPPYQLDMIRGASRYFILSTLGLIFTLISIIINVILIFFNNQNRLSFSRGFQIYFAFIIRSLYQFYLFIHAIFIRTKSV